MATNFISVKLGKIGLFTFIRSPGIPESYSNIAILIIKGLSVMIWLHCVHIW